MSSLTQFLALSGALNSTVFTTSGTFTPSSKLIANGGGVFVYLVGGGTGGGNASLPKLLQTTVLTPTTVTVGGVSGTSSFNGLSATGANAAPTGNVRASVAGDPYGILQQMSPNTTIYGSPGVAGLVIIFWVE